MVKQPVHLFAAMLALAVASFGCDPRLEPSDEDQYGLNVELWRPLGSQSHHALVGSTFTVFVEQANGGEVDPDGGGLGCVTQSGSGVVVELEDGLFMVEAAGDGAVELADPGISCPANDDILAELGPDRWSVIGTDPANVVGRWASWPDGYILASNFSPGPQGVFPDILSRPLDDVRVVADSRFTASPALVRSIDDEEVEVRWTDDDNVLMLPEHYDHLRPRNDDGTVQQGLDGVLGAGESFTSSVSILGTAFQLPVVRAVPVEAIASLELIPVYDGGNAEREWGPPAGVVAITRDIEGRRIIDAPVAFDLTAGHLSLIQDHDALILGDSCRRPPAAPTARAASITATLGELETSVDLEWIALPGDYRGEADDPNCVQSCACTSSTPGESTPGVLALFGLGMWLRLRRRSR